MTENISNYNKKNQQLFLNDLRVMRLVMCQLLPSWLDHINLEKKIAMLVKFSVFPCSPFDLFLLFLL